MSLDFLKKLFQRENPNTDSLFTAITRPLSYWIILISFIILIFLISFNIAKNSDALNYLKEVLIVVIGFYFAGRSAEKISKVKNTNNFDNKNSMNCINNTDNSKMINKLNNISNNSDNFDNLPLLKTKDQI